ncbi:Transmembrane protease serine 6 [Desmophyllum pertusum]|uniref:Transmembrane protease serine 6 n=1 Tax=Desmophyllum pertusum TaxID=174260 RepID=A0A9W9Y8E3_9CNID|nr:Transmembrane protease serine 6 [Desmophyllum pertusum]
MTSPGPVVSPGPGPVVPPGPGPVDPSGGIECGTKAQGFRIVGGTQAQPGAWPWQVTIDYKGHSAKHWCGGSIVAPQWIVDHDLNRNDGFEQNIPIERIISHPLYAGQTDDYDLALIKLQRPLVYNDRVRPVCLPELNFPADTNCYVTGWGATSEGSPQILRQARVPLILRSTCQAGYQDLAYTITSRMLCAGYAAGGIDACQGDSGGPLSCPRNSIGILLVQ